MTISLNDLLRDTHVDGFVDYLAGVISGNILIHHQYLDRYLDRLYRENRNGHEPERDFQTLDAAFSVYYWPTPDKDFRSNLKTLRMLKNMIDYAKGHKNNERIYEAISWILWWGAGNRNAAIFVKNRSWLDQNNNSASAILNMAQTAFDANPFDANLFDGVKLRSNAGFTKVYALAYDDFIIYDSRVAAAIGLLVVKYSEQCTPPLKNVPNYLKFAWMNAAGGDNRNPSRGNYVFPYAYNHSLHARSNWIANILLRKAVERLIDRGVLPDWVGNRGEAPRRIEAALFMLGKDIPILPQDGAQLPEGGMPPAPDYNTQLEAVRSSADDDAGWAALPTLTQRAEFLYRINEDESIDFRFGGGNAHQVTLDGGVMNRLCHHFLEHGWFPVGSSHDVCENRVLGSLGRWLCEDGIQINIASYVASFLVEEGRANYRVGGNRGELEIVR